MGQGIIRVELRVFEKMLLLPDGIEASGIFYDPQSRSISVLVHGEAIPTVDENCVLPNLSLLYEYGVSRETHLLAIQSGRDKIYESPSILPPIS